MFDVSTLSIKAAISLREALAQMDRAGEGVLLLVDHDGRLLRTVTDGDLRRLLLAGAQLGDRLEVLPEKPPVCATEVITAPQALALMAERGIDHLPLLDATGHPVELMLRRELDRQILLSTPHISDFELGFVEEAFRTNWIAPLGPNVDAFESEFAAYIGVPHAAALSSGTAAIHLALRLLGISPGDTVFCSSLTFVASINPVLYEGGRPVFVDSDPETWNMSPAALSRALESAQKAGELPKAVIVVHLYGQTADMDAIATICERYGVSIIEDAAESLGATYKGRQSGGTGRLGAFSFNGNKIITTSGGGMLVSADAAQIERARFLSTQARDPAPWYEHSVVGYNYRMSNVLAGIGRGQLRVIAERIAARRAVFERYRTGLAHLEGLHWMPEATYGTCTRWLSVCTIDPDSCPLTPEEVIGSLSRSGIDARRVWKPMHRQPLFKGCAYYPISENLSFSDWAFESGICLPSGSNMSEEDQRRIIRSIEQIFVHSKRHTAVQSD